MAKPSNSEGLKGPSTDQIKMGESLRHADHAPPGEKPVSQAAYEPYTTPKDYKPPTMREQWLYAATRHPYAKYGYAAAFGLGLTVYALVTINRVEDVHKKGVASRSQPR